MDGYGYIYIHRYMDVYKPYLYVCPYPHVYVGMDISVYICVHRKREKVSQTKIRQRD